MKTIYLQRFANGLNHEFVLNIVLVSVAIIVALKRSAFRGKEGSKMVISKVSLESKMLYNFEVNFSNMIGKAIFKYPNQF